MNGYLHEIQILKSHQGSYSLSPATTIGMMALPPLPISSVTRLRVLAAGAADSNEATSHSSSRTDGGSGALMSLWAIASTWRSVTISEMWRLHKFKNAKRRQGHHCSPRTRLVQAGVQSVDHDLPTRTRKGSRSVCHHRW